MEIKFRVWYKNKMYDVLNIGFGSDCIERVEIIDKAVVYTEWHNMSELDLMLSLGVKDKNQQIIFNKDIIRHDFTDYDAYQPPIGDGHPVITHYGIVVLKSNYCENGFQITNLVPGDYSNAPFYDEMGQNFIWNELEIIGNVYETVLLKCSHCDNIEFTADSETIGSCSICGEQNLINIDLSKYKGES